MKEFSMLNRQIGTNSPPLSALGLGAMSFSDFYGPASDAEAFATLTACLELGITHIDTANVYGGGRSETLIGQFLAEQGPALRQNLHIATKAGIARHPETGARYYNNSLAYLEAELDKSLARLQTDYIDLYYIHRRDPELPIEEVTGFLVRMLEKGKLLQFGFSEIAPSSLRRAAAVHPVAAVQSEYSLAVRYPELGLVQTCAELGTALVAFSPVGRGLLTDRPYRAEQVAEIAFLRGNPRFMEPNLSANLAITDKFRALAAEAGRPAAALAIGWLLAQGPHILPIPGTKSAKHLAELAQGAVAPMGDDLLAAIDKVLPVGWAHGERYSEEQWHGPEKYC
jgi:aryl-alcohol dehydrogenase-like predicted oxidoreductase